MATRARKSAPPAKQIDPPLDDFADIEEHIEDEEVISLRSNDLVGKQNGKAVEEPVTGDSIKDSSKESDVWEHLKLPKLPCKIGSTISLNIAEDWFKLITNEDAQDRIWIYVYRLWPVIVRPRQQRNIDKTPLRLYSFNKIIANHGGGEYKFIVNDTNTTQTLFNVKATIDSALYDPIVNLKELDLAAKENQSYVEALKNKGLMNSEGRPLVNQTSNPMQSNGQDSRMAEVLGEIAKLAMSSTRNQQPNTPDGNMTALTTLFLEKMKQDDPSKGLSGFAELVKALQPANKPVEDSGNKAAMQMLLDEVKSLRESNQKLTDRVLDMVTKQQETKSDNSLDQIDKVLGILDKIKDRNEDNTTAPVKQSMLDKLIDKGLPILGPLLQGLAIKGMGLPPIPPQQQLEASQDIGNLANAVNGEPTVEVPQQPVNPIATDLELKQLTDLVLQYGMMIGQKINGGATGWEFALDLEPIFGDNIWKQVVAYPPDKILLAFKTVPAFWNMIKAKGETYIAKWISDFIEYKKIAAEREEETDEDDDETEVPVQ